VIERFSQIFTGQGGFTGAVLDVGVGTGVLLTKLVSRFPGSFFYGVDLAPGMAKHAAERLSASGRVACICSEAESLPFADCSMDHVVSTSTYQWVDPLVPAFAEVLRVLKHGGRFSFALFGYKTLYELRESYQCALRSANRSSADRSHRFVSAADLYAALQSAGFKECLIREEIEVEMHADVAHLLRSLKRIGAGNASPESSGGLSGKSVMKEMAGYYQHHFGTDAGIPASYEVLYGTGVKL
jgi:malonyl-CoA O-methyltransferase